MAVERTIITAVRVWESDGTAVEHPWDPAKWYLIRDDLPYLDIQTRGHPAQLKNAKIKLEPVQCESGMQWQRWDLSEELSRTRRFGEVSETLKVPKNCSLRCYVIPTALLSYRDILTMVEDIEVELGIPIAWNKSSDPIKNGRSWSTPLIKSRPILPSETLINIKAEIIVADSIRRNPFIELGPKSRSDTPLPENAVVSQWAMRRSAQLHDLADGLLADLEVERNQGALKNPEGRQKNIDSTIIRIETLLNGSIELSARLTSYVNGLEIGTPIQLSPLFQRDHRLRLLLRAFAPKPSEAIAESQSVRSSYPPVLLRDLWELWGIVWIAKQLRGLGFSGMGTLKSINSVKRCSWHFEKDDIIIKLDFEAEPTFVDYEHMPPVHERAVPALEWAARHQKIDSDRPFLGSEEKCSPDYLIRIVTSTTNALLVGDAALATPDHHKKKVNQIDTKPQMVERYRRTIGWVDGDQIVRCHPMGAFVVLPRPAHEWSELETVTQARDCMLLCPGPLDDAEASARLRTLLISIVPEFRFQSSNTR